MTNREYVEDLLALNEKIYIDTSSLMNDTELGRFFSAISRYFWISR